MILPSAPALSSLAWDKDGSSGQWEKQLDVSLNPVLTLSQLILINS